jgi:hypothetical protein
LRGVPAGWVAENKNGQSPFLVGAREGAALPLNDFDFKDFKDLKILKIFLLFPAQYIILEKLSL